MRKKKQLKKFTYKKINKKEEWGKKQLKKFTYKKINKKEEWGKKAVAACKEKDT